MVDTCGGGLLLACGGRYQCTGGTGKWWITTFDSGDLLLLAVMVYC